MEPAAPASVPSSNAVRASPFPVPQRPDNWIFGRMADPRSPRSSVLPTFGPSTKRAPPNMPSADSCAAIFDPYGSLSLQAGDTSQVSRGKIDRLHRTPAGFTTPVLDGRGLRDQCSLVRPGRPRDPVLVHRAAALLHASFRPHLAMTPLRFANPSPPSDWIEDFHLQAVDHARHTTQKGPRPGALSICWCAAVALVALLTFA